MIKYIEHQEIDKNKWDDCIKHAFNGVVYAYSWFLDTICANWDALVMGDYETIFPLVWNKKYGIYYIYQPFFTQQLGVFSVNKLSKNIVDEFLNNIPKRFGYVIMNLNIHNTTQNPDFLIKEQVTSHLNLISEYPAIYKAYSDNTKRNIKKAEKIKISINKNMQPEDLISLFKSEQGTRLRHIKDKHYADLLRIMYLTIHKNTGKTWGAYDTTNSLCAAAFFIESHKKIIYLSGSTNDAGRNSGASHYLFDTFIKEHAATPKIFDFEGSSIPSLARFYKSFGAKEVIYLQIKRNQLPWYIKWLKQ